MKKTFWILFFILTFCVHQYNFASENGQTPQKKILVIVEGTSNLKNFAMGDGRQLAALLGHFNTNTIIKGVQDYKFGEINNYDYTFYVGLEILCQQNSF